MKLIAHCFAEDISITPNLFKFKFKDFEARLFSVEKKLTLELSKIINEEEFAKFSKSVIQGNEIKIIDTDLDARLLPYKIILTEAAQLVEGLFALMYGKVAPHFDTAKLYVNLYGENEKEINDLMKGNLTRGAGYVELPVIKSYIIDESMADLIENSMLHLPAFSFFSHAVRSLKENDNEVAFFLLFRILDGYFSDGSKDVEKAMQKKENDLKIYIPYENELIKSLQSILVEMRLKSKSANGFNGLITDIVLIRHKLTHFSFTNANTHHSAAIKFELVTVTKYLYSCCFNLLRDKIRPEPN